MMNNPQVIVALNKISKKYDGKVILSDLDLEIYDGEFLTLLGPSGCGKTTLLRLLAGLESVDGGTIHLAGDEITHIPAEHRHINTVFQSYALFPHMTVFENVAFGLEMQKVPASEIRQRVEETLAMVQLTELANRRPDQLSGGQQQRVGLARALVRGKPLLLLDEPFSALDPALRREMLAEVARLACEQSITVLMVSHNPEDAQLIADQVLFVDEGRIALQGKPDILQNSEHPGLLRYLGQ